MENPIGRFDLLLTACGLRLTPNLLGSLRLASMVTWILRSMIFVMLAGMAFAFAKERSVLVTQQLMELSANGILMVVFAIRCATSCDGFRSYVQQHMQHRECEDGSDTD